jgi:hypothetical protein
MEDYFHLLHPLIQILRMSQEVGVLDWGDLVVVWLCLTKWQWSWTLRALLLLWTWLCSFANELLQQFAWPIETSWEDEFLRVLLLLFDDEQPIVLAQWLWEKLCCREILSARQALHPPLHLLALWLEGKN